MFCVQIGVAVPWFFRTFTWPGGSAPVPVDPGFVVRARLLPWPLARVRSDSRFLLVCQITVITMGVMLCIMMLVTQTLSWTLNNWVAALAMLFYAWFIIQFSLQSKGVILESC